jgi:hypothetical protein
VALIQVQRRCVAPVTRARFGQGKSLSLVNPQPHAGATAFDEALANREVII